MTERFCLTKLTCAICTGFFKRNSDAMFTVNTNKEEDLLMKWKWINCEIVKL